MSLVSRLVSASVLLASSVGCRAEVAHTEEGRLDVVVRPDSAAASGRPVQGSFVLHDMLQAKDGRAVDWLAVVDAYETLSVALPAGAYWLEWRPQLSFGAVEDVAARARETAKVGAVPLVVAADRVTTVNVQVALAPSPDAEVSALDADTPCVDILIARH